MSGRSGCLLFLAFVLSSTTFSVGQEEPLARFAPRVPVDPPPIHLPERIVHYPRAPISPPGMFGFPQFAGARRGFGFFPASGSGCACWFPDDGDAFGRERARGS